MFALQILRSTFKSLSNNIKSAAGKNVEAELLIKSFYAEHLVWGTNWALMAVPPAPAKSTQSFTFQQPSQYASEPSQSSVLAIADTPKGKGKSQKDGKSKQSRGDITLELPSTKKPKLEPSPANMQQMMKLLQSSGDKNNLVKQSYDRFRTEAGVFWSEHCRNCFVGNKGFVKHTLFECQKARNICNLPCSKCRQGVHWANECPNHQP